MKLLVPKTALTVVTAAAALLAIPAMASAAPLHVAAKHASKVTVTASPRVALAGTTVKLTGTVKSANPVPSGTITFWHGKTKLCSAKLSKKSAHCDTKFDTAGSYAVSGVYSGDSKHSGSTGKVTVVSDKAATTTAIKVSTASTTTGTKVTFTADVSSKSPLAVAGTVKFTSSNGTLGSATVSKGVAHITYGWKSQGSYKVTATYQGNAAHAASHATSGAITVKAPTYTTTTTITGVTSTGYPGYPADVPVGFSGLLTVTVTSPAGVPTGTVTVTPTGKNAGLSGFTCTDVPLTDRTATCTITPPTGTFGIWPLAATYNSDSTHAKSTSATYDLVVPDTTGTGVSFDATTDTITATVTNEAGSNIPGTSGGVGTVTFSVAGVDVCTDAPITYTAATGNTATCAYTPTGSVTVTAAFSGNEFNLPSMGSGTASAGGGGGD